MARKVNLKIEIELVKTETENRWNREATEKAEALIETVVYWMKIQDMVCLIFKFCLFL